MQCSLREDDLKGISRAQPMAAPQNGKAGASQAGHPSPGEEEAGAAHPRAWVALKGPQPVPRDPCSAQAQGAPSPAFTTLPMAEMG